MQVLLKSVKVIAPASEFHQQTIDIYIQDGVISAINPDLTLLDAPLTTVEQPGLCVSAGWLDLNAWVGDPGLEHKEDLQSAALAAAKGGFTEVVCLPNVEPVHQTKNAINYIQNQTRLLPVSFHAFGAITTDTHGKELTEMIDLHEAGAVAFTDGLHPVQQADVLVKALQYVQFFGGLIIQKPENTSLTQHGLMHEGVVSTQLGLKGMPPLAEEVIIARDLRLLKYTGGRLHFTLISSAEAVDLVREAKKQGLPVTCDVAAYQTAFTDEEIIPFDTNYKVNPPFRSPQDREAIEQGLQDGTIDALVTAHRPQDTESKNLEFDMAEFGITSLETAFAVANTYLGPVIGLDQVIAKLTDGPRQILQMAVPEIKAGAIANLTLFHPEQTWTPAEANSASKSFNNPFYGKNLQGQVFGIINKSQVVFNPNFALS
ncbi:dihydroorotase [Adhaeribacter swui]|uniref:Dihydroorotase n=1 Tax=Adhaeribacter swui TaxID=2086471 RepID=A0A7G7GBS0_9BACT|nr:dihydroorotase [Adhaeribacter swui]QNF34604.1 dihydroorotase [Adhaeribacter swui]